MATTHERKRREGKTFYIRNVLRLISVLSIGIHDTSGPFQCFRAHTLFHRNMVYKNTKAEIC